jgi:hypothetical protein
MADDVLELARELHKFITEAHNKAHPSYLPPTRERPRAKREEDDPEVVIYEKCLEKLDPDVRKILPVILRNLSDALSSVRLY